MDRPKPWSLWTYKANNAGHGSKYVVLTIATPTTEAWDHSLEPKGAVVYFPVCAPAEHRVCSLVDFLYRFKETL